MGCNNSVEARSSSAPVHTRNQEQSLSVVVTPTIFMPGRHPPSISEVNLGGTSVSRCHHIESQSAGLPKKRMPQRSTQTPAHSSELEVVDAKVWRRYGRSSFATAMNSIVLPDATTPSNRLNKEVSKGATSMIPITKAEETQAKSNTMKFLKGKNTNSSRKETEDKFNKTLTDFNFSSQIDFKSQILKTSGQRNHSKNMLPITPIKASKPSPYAKALESTSIIIGRNPKFRSEQNILDKIRIQTPNKEKVTSTGSIPFGQKSPILSKSFLQLPVFADKRLPQKEFQLLRSFVHPLKSNGTITTMTTKVHQVGTPIAFMKDEREERQFPGLNSDKIEY